MVALLTCVRTSCVLDATEVGLHPDADGVVGVGQHQAAGMEIVEALGKGQLVTITIL